MHARHRPSGDRSADGRRAGERRVARPARQLAVQANHLDDAVKDEQVRRPLATLRPAHELMISGGTAQKKKKKNDDSHFETVARTQATIACIVNN
jgi:hypothetical protein